MCVQSKKAAQAWRSPVPRDFNSTSALLQQCHERLLSTTSPLYRFRNPLIAMSIVPCSQQCVSVTRSQRDRACKLIPRTITVHAPPRYSLPSSGPSPHMKSLPKYLNGGCSPMIWLAALDSSRYMPEADRQKEAWDGLRWRTRKHAAVMGAVDNQVVRKAYLPIFLSVW